MKPLQWLRAPLRVWRSSLPLRIVGSTFVASALVLCLGGLLLSQQVTQGMIEAKRQSSISQASATFSQMQQQLRSGADGTATALYERLNRLADQFGSQGEQYIIIEGSLSGLRSSGISTSTIPSDLREQNSAQDGMWIAPTLIHYSDPARAAEPGLAVGVTLEAPGSANRIPTYFIFPMTTEVATLDALRKALLSTGLLLIMALTAIAHVVSRQVIRPIRQASEAAGRIASGELDDRLTVDGTDDIASLATSMNNMASELQTQIVRLEHLSNVQQRFVSDVSHELRTPLTTVKMAAEVLHDARQDMDPAAARSSELLHGELERFEALLNDLLEISRFDAGAATLSLEEADIVDLARAAAEALRAVADRAGTTVTVSSDGPALALVDPRRIRRLISNLISNAIEHGECLPIQIRVACDDQAVGLSVRDHGVGFLPEQANLVFERFWRADPSRNRTLGGTGLGLAIAKEDAALHHGWLDAWGRPGKGAQFRLTLPKRPDICLQESPLAIIPEDITAEGREAR